LKYRPIIAAVFIFFVVVLLYSYIASGNEDHSFSGGKISLGKTKVKQLIQVFV